jgi:hypothetical protein
MDENRSQIWHDDEDFCGKHRSHLDNVSEIYRGSRISIETLSQALEVVHKVLIRIAR